MSKIKDSLPFVILAIITIDIWSSMPGFGIFTKIAILWYCTILPCILGMWIYDVVNKNEEDEEDE